jgi:hypothetical protein
MHCGQHWRAERPLMHSACGAQITAERQIELMDKAMKKAGVTL